MNLSKLADYHLWANNRVRSKIIELTQEQYTKEVIPPYNSIQRLVLHTILAVEHNLKSRVKGVDSNPDALVEKISGMSIDEVGITKMAQRILNLVRAYHVRDGLKRENDTILKHTFQRIPPPPAEKLEPSTFNKLIDKVYEIRGWNKEGIPTKETLKKSDLDYVRQDLEQRGILDN